MNPIDDFMKLYAEAVAAGLPQPEAMALGTCTDGRPAVRIVLFRGISGGGLRFFTNYESRKGRELAANPHAAATFYWEPLGRQVRFEGRVERLDAAESDEYFHARPRGHQIGAWASLQSTAMSHAEVVARYEALERQHEGKEVPRPPHWGGFRLVPDLVEIWTSEPNRLHRRVAYRRAGAGGEWVAEELAP